MRRNQIRYPWKLRSISQPSWCIVRARRKCLVDIRRQEARDSHELPHEPNRRELRSTCRESDDGRLCREERRRGEPEADPELAKRGSIEVTARLVEIPEGAIFDRELYNYATVLKYEVLEVHRGKVKGETIYVGHYNPSKPRSEVADRRVQDVGGTLKSFRAGDVHRMALEESMLDHFTGGILNKYSGEDTDPIYWAVWTVLVSD